VNSDKLITEVILCCSCEDS